MFNRLLGDLADRFLKDRDLMEATMGAGALVAHAEGGVSPAEREKVITFLRKHKTLQKFDAFEAIRLFDSYVEQLELEQLLGEDACLKECRDIRNPDKAMLVARLALAIGRADDEGDENPTGASAGLSSKELLAFKQVLTALRVSPSEFGLRG